MADSKSTSKLVQMRLQPKTIQRIEHLADITGTENRTNLIASSIELADELISSVKEGSKIYIEKKDGTKELLKIIGI